MWFEYKCLMHLDVLNSYSLHFLRASFYSKKCFCFFFWEIDIVKLRSLMPKNINVFPFAEFVCWLVLSSRAHLQRLHMLPLPPRVGRNIFDSLIVLNKLTKIEAVTQQNFLMNSVSGNTFCCINTCKSEDPACKQWSRPCKKQYGILDTPPIRELLIPSKGLTRTQLRLTLPTLQFMTCVARCFSFLIEVKFFIWNSLAFTSYHPIFKIRF